MQEYCYVVLTGNEPVPLEHQYMGFGSMQCLVCGECRDIEKEEEN